MSASVATRVAPDALKKAIYARRDHFLANVATLTMKQARRLIETDLGLDAKALDETAAKAAVAKYVDRVLAAGDRPPEKKTAAAFKENRPPAAAASPAPAKPATFSDADERGETEMDERYSDESDGESDTDSEPPSTKKRHAGDNRFGEKESARKKKKGGGVAGKNAAAAPAITGAVFTLREVCKKAGLTFQHVFMRHKTDEGRIEALRAILRDHGLDENASEKRIAKVRAAVELAKDLDGIDAGNVIEGGRRRRAAATDQWGQTIDYAEREDARDDDDDEEESDSEDEEDSDDASDDSAASDSEDDADADEEAPTASADSDVEPADVFFFFEEEEEEEEEEESGSAKAETANDAKPAKPAALKAPRRGGALVSDSDEE